MNSMNDDRMFDLAMKVIARQCSDAERAEFEARLSRQPELRAEFERLQADVRLAKEALPLVDAAQASAGELPRYARSRLQTKVQQTLGRPEPAGKEPDRSLAWGWRWWLGLAAAATAVIIVLLVLPPSAPRVQIQLAMLDLAGTTRSGGSNETAVLAQTWKGSKVEIFSDAGALRKWETSWPVQRNQPIVRVIYDHSAGVVRVSGRQAAEQFTNSFPVDPDLHAAIAKAQAWIQERLKQ
jgi:anti-sigma factor RsiW